MFSSQLLHVQITAASIWELCTTNAIENDLPRNDYLSCFITLRFVEIHLDAIFTHNILCCRAKIEIRI